VPKNNRSIEEIKQSFLEDMGCASCGDSGMSSGDGGFSADADADGPVAGYDPVLTKKKKLDKVLKRRKTT